MNADNLKKINEKLSIIIDELRKKTNSRIISEIVLNYMQNAMITFAEPLNIMIMGEFSTGKSSFINALIGKEILKTNDTPTTATITKISYGDDDKVVVHYVDGSFKEETVKNFEKLTSVTKSKSANNFHESILYVERFIPVDCLKKINIIDSPGLNDSCEKHVEVTKNYINNTDVILWIFTIQNAGTKSEIEALDTLNEYLKPIGIVNKIDMLDDEDDSLEEELQDISNRLGKRVENLVAISSKMALQGKIENNKTLITESNIEQIDKYIINNIIPSQEKIKTIKITDKIIIAIDSILGSIEDCVNDIKNIENINIDKYTSECMKYTALKNICKEIFDIILNDATEQDKQLMTAIELYYGLIGIAEKNKASKFIKDLATRKNIKAQYLLGKYYYGIREYSKAIYWYRKAAKSGLSYAQFVIGILFFDKKFRESVNLLPNEARKCLDKAAKSGFSYANFVCGKILLEVAKNRKERDLGVNYIYRSAIDGVSDAQLFIADILYNLDSNDKNKEAYSWLEKASSANNVEALYCMGVLNYEGRYPVEKNFYKARKYWEKASEYNYTQATVSLINFYKNDVKNDRLRKKYYTKTIEYVNNKEEFKIEYIHFKKIIDIEHSKTLFFRVPVSSKKIDYNIENNEPYTNMSINELYQLALKYKKDSMAKAEKIFEEILNKLNAHENKYLIGKIYKELGLIAEESKNYQKAFSYYKKSADNENDEGKYYLALCYARGYGVKEDFSMAKALLSTIQYLPKAKSVLSDITHSEKSNNSHIEKKEVKTSRELYEEAIKYKNGEGVAKNNQEAINIFKRILKIKDAFNNRKLIGDVYNQLGIIAEEEYNYNEAFDWYQKSANCDYDYGTYNLAMCYVSGIGTQKDDGKAARIFSSIKYLPEASEMLNKLWEKSKENNKQNESTVSNDFISDVMKKITNFFFE